MDRRRFLAAGLAAAATPLLLSVDPARAGVRQKVPAPTASLVTRWDVDRWSLGSYSALPPGTSPAVRRTLADAIIGGRIALAGEYASTQFPATVTGSWNAKATDAMATLQVTGALGPATLTFPAP